MLPIGFPLTTFMVISLVQIPVAKLNLSETPVKCRDPSSDWSTISATDSLGFVSEPPVTGELWPNWGDGRRPKRFLFHRKICGRPIHRHQHHQRRDLGHHVRSRKFKPNGRCTVQSFQKVRCCRRRSHRPDSLDFKGFGFNIQTKRGSENDGRLVRDGVANVQTQNSRSKRHKNSEQQGYEVTETLSALSSPSSSSSPSSLLPLPSTLSSSSSSPAEELHLDRYNGELTDNDVEIESLQRNRQHRNMKNKKNLSNESAVGQHLDHPTISWSTLSTAETVHPSAPKSRTFKITIGQVIPQRRRSSRRDQRRQEGLKSRRLNITLSSTHQTQTSFSNESLVLFEGVWNSKMKELNQLLAEEDFETALMEFIELAYQDQPRHEKRATVLQDNAGEGSLPGTAPSVRDFGITSLRPNQTSEDKIKICDFRLNYDASKLVNLESYFKNQLLKTRILSNSLSTLLLSKPFKFRDKLTRDMKRLATLLEALLKDDSKMVGAALAFDPSQVGPTEPAISPYVVKTRKGSQDSENSTEGHDDRFTLYNVSSLSKDSYGLSGVKGFEWFWKLRNDYSYLLWRHQSNCQQNANSTVRIPLTLKNETYWGPIQSDCIIRQLDERSRVQHPAGSRTEQFGVWTIAHSVPIFGCGHLQNPVFLGVLKVDMDLTGLEFVQCSPNNKNKNDNNDNDDNDNDDDNNNNNSSPLFFHLTHNCPQHTQCQHLPRRGFRRGSYKCLCTPVSSIWDDEVQSNPPIVDDTAFGNSTSNDSTIYSITPTAAILSRGCYLDGGHLERCYLDQFFNRSSSSHSTSASLGLYNVCRECLVFLDQNGCPSSFMYDHHRSQQLLEDYNYWMRGVPLGIQCFTILTGFTIAVVVARLKKNRVMMNSIWVLLEFTILGAIILHFSVILAYFECTPTNCIVIVWCREVGFLLVYGSLLLKLHRTLSEFQSRKAHRVQWRDRDLIRCLLSMFVVLIFSLASWTAAVVDGLTAVGDLLSTIRIEPKKALALSFSIFSTVQGVCRLSIKDRLLEAGELLFLAYSSYMCYKVRKAPTEFYENRYITFCVLNETLVSVIYYSFRYFSNTVLHPDYMFLAFFIRCHVTASTTVTLVVCSKLWYSCWPPRDVPVSDRTRSYSTAPSVDSRAGQANNPSSPPASSPVQAPEPSKTTGGNWDLSEFDITNSTAEDIRYELRKLYTQLQIYKTKTMRQDNPHISKRRGGKKQTNRKFSFQTLHSKYKQQSSFSSSHAVATTPSGSGGCGASVAGDHGENSMATVGGEAELSVRSPEDSSNSMEGVSVYMDESSYAAPEVATTVATTETTKKHKTLKSILTAARNKSKRSS